MGNYVPTINAEDHFDLSVLYYDSDNNAMFDCDGNVVWDIFNVITPAQLYVFKKLKQWMLVQGVHNQPVELCYPEEHTKFDYEYVSISQETDEPAGFRIYVKKGDD